MKKLVATLGLDKSAWLEYRKMGISDSASNELEAHAYAIIKGIENIELRNMHIMQGI